MPKVPSYTIEVKLREISGGGGGLPCKRGRGGGGLPMGGGGACRGDNGTLIIVLSRAVAENALTSPFIINDNSNTQSCQKLKY